MEDGAPVKYRPFTQWHLYVPAGPLTLHFPSRTNAILTPSYSLLSPLIAGTGLAFCSGICEVMTDDNVCSCSGMMTALPEVSVIVRNGNKEIL